MHAIMTSAPAIRLTVGAMLFDLDGVLVDSSKAVRRSWSAWAGRRGFDEAEVVAFATGHRSVETVQHFGPSPGRDAMSEAAEIEAAQVEDKADLSVVPGAPDTVASILGRRWAVITSGGRRVAASRLEAAGLPQSPLLIAAEDVTEGKPSPEGYLKAAADLGVGVSTCVVLEDSSSGIRAGLAAGMAVIGVGADLVPEEEALLARIPTLEALHVTPDGNGLLLVVDPAPQQGTHG
jgi:sugar-phosphatase